MSVIGLSGECFPALVQAPAQQTHGVLYRGIADVEWDCLDKFEGSMYRREIVTVTSNDAGTLSAWTYILRSSYQHLLSAGHWDLESFIVKDMQKFLRQL